MPDIELQDEQRNEEATKAEWETAQAQLRLMDKARVTKSAMSRKSRSMLRKLQLEFCQVRSADCRRSRRQQGAGGPTG